MADIPVPEVAASHGRVSGLEEKGVRTTVVGVDLGTQGLKVVFYDVDRREVVASETAALDVQQNGDGVAEQRHHWWLSALEDAVGRVDPTVRCTAAALSVSGQQHGFVALDAANEVLAPVKLWCDTSTEQECQDIMRDFGGASACIAEVGNLILPGYTASKIRWLKHAQPRVYDKLDAILLPHDYLNLYLTGERCMEMGDASGTGFLDVRRRT